jgi:primosomal protein N' (replication factor Y) (superfamily II helicase)
VVATQSSFDVQPRDAVGKFADVAVNAGQPARKPFTYAISDGMDVRPGQAVFVPFGPKILQGIVLDVAATSFVDSVRPIAAIAEAAPVLDAIHAALARWISDAYLAPLWECVSACLPSGYGQKSVTMVSPVDVPPLLPIYPKDQAILQFVAAHGRVSADALREAVGPVTMQRLERLQKDGHLTVAQGLARPSGHARFERRVAPARGPAELMAGAEQLEQAAPRSIAARLLRALARGEVTLMQARGLGATAAHIRALEAEGWLRTSQERVERNPLEHWTFEQRPPLVLSPEQESVARDIALQPGKIHLIHGVTGSGKTEVYLDVVRRTLEAGRGVIILVPEIALTPQAIRRFGERFGETLTVLHSSLSTGELYDQWFRVQRGDARVVLGSRSAVFAPVANLGLIVMDEEHEWSYKQAEPQPRYHARDVAERLCRLTGATLVLGSATPDVLTYHRAVTGDATLHELRTRRAPVGDGSTTVGAMATATVVDMREELKSGNRSVFSFRLKRAIRAALQAGEQSILFVNRRGSARFMLCRACGHIPVCSSCQIPMSLDAANALHATLRCHNCSRSKRLEERCPHCDSAKYRPFGVGTQRIEQEARAEFPGARIARWDSDVASRKGSHERIVRALEEREIDVLVGTQMLAKGLDLPEMTVVGVVDADVGLSLPDYRASERTFQLLSQVSGRAGRRDKPGWVYIQTYDPEALPIVCAANHDYRAFYEAEIAHRRRAGYPPFTRLVRLVYRDGQRDHGLEEATRVATEIRMARDAAGRAEPDVLGPNAAHIARVRGEYRWQIVLRGQDPARALDGVRLGQHWSVDVDPVSLL